MQFDYLNRKWNILVIDDSRLNRAIISKTLSELHFNIEEAFDGLQGIEKLKKANFDLILVDIIMPNLDGFGFLGKFRDYTGTDFVPVILMTGTDDLNSKIKGLRSGADDFLLKPLNEKELVARVLSLLRLKSAHDELYQKNLMIQKEMEIAKRVQRYIIPTDFSYIDYPRVSGRYLPIEDIGGDYFDCYKLPDERTGFLIADVAGHGIPAALVMTMSKMIFNVYSGQYFDTSELLATVNSQMRGFVLDNQYITSFYAIYDHRSRQLHFTNAGHVKALYYRAAKKGVLALDTNGLFIGIADESLYEQKTISVTRGDRLLLYTDGISEIQNSGREQYGEQRLAKSIQKNAAISGDAFCDALLEDLGSFAPLNGRNDDIAILNIEF